MKTLTVRGIDEKLSEAIKEVSRKKQESMNQTVLKILKEGVGLSTELIFPKYHDLDSLAGTWSEREAEEFLKNVQSFDEIDGDLWK